jgi:hypothetical protein
MLGILLFIVRIAYNRCFFTIISVLRISMNSIGENCNELKEQYDNCFLKWFSGRFLKGDTNDEMCAPFFKVYQQCVKVYT